ncbi:MAG: peptidase P60 [Alphaproteobacteria bacterium]|nr:peptidase P60 [Alphaproteobacteria bacterium]
MFQGQLKALLSALSHEYVAETIYLVEMAKKFIKPTLQRCTLGRVPVYGQPDLSGPMISEVRFGEMVDVFDVVDNIAWVQNRADDYVGYTFADAYGQELCNPQHRVGVLRTFLFSAPRLKSQPIDMLTLGTLVEVMGAPEDGFVPINPHGWIYEKHLMPTDVYYHPVETALRLLGVPYLWGGRSPVGCDCSGLVQLCLELAGVQAPRDSDQQRHALATDVIIDWESLPLERGDIIFMDGHVGLMASAFELVHANAHHMQVTVEPLADAVVQAGPLVAWASAKDFMQAVAA